MAQDFCGCPGGNRNNRWLRRRRLPPCRRCRGNTAEVTNVTSAPSIAERFAVLPPMLVAERVDNLRKSLIDAQLDALLLTAASNIRYLTGF
ncbi:MAG: hypothetical protein F2561_08305, partial [Actinobacteria bacterium]|nr:hypothetical protein [Actinomycetota bacterium]